MIDTKVLPPDSGSERASDMTDAAERPPVDAPAIAFRGRAAPSPAQSSAFGELRAEILAEQAASLEHAGRQLELSLTALREAVGPARAKALAAAREAFWNLVVQRDAIGFRNSEELIADHGIPSEVVQAIIPAPLVPLRQWT